MSVALLFIAVGLLILPRHHTASARHRGHGWPIGRLTRAHRSARRGRATDELAGRDRLSTALTDGSARGLGTARRDDATTRAELPIVLDLAAVALRAGAAVGPALAAASLAAGAGLGRQLRDVAGLLSLGVDSADAWAELQDVPALRTTAIVAARAGASGARLADGFAAVAAQLRADAVTDAERAAARVGVWSVLPLGLCFLPAFVCLGIVPAVVGLLSQFTVDGAAPV